MNALVVVFMAIASVTAENLCTPGTFYKQDCNICYCSKDGKIAACTDMHCPSDNFNNFNQLKTVQSFCKPGSTFSPDNCNRCKCSADGTTAACTMILCSDKVEEVSQPKQVCTPRSQLKHYCNTCACAEDGLSYTCTRMMCDKSIWNMDGSFKFSVSKASDDVYRSVNDKVCEPNSQFKEQCNTCICSDNGLSKTCTMMNCDMDVFNRDGSLKSLPAHRKNTRTEKNVVCTPNSVFKEQCNTCFCSKDGLSKSCTMMLCSDSDVDKNIEVEEVAKGPKNTAKFSCRPKSVYSPDGCNTCICNEFGTQAACTFKLCPPTLKKTFK